MPAPSQTHTHTHTHTHTSYTHTHMLGEGIWWVCACVQETWVQSWVGRSPGGGHGNPLYYSCLENPRGQRSLEGYGPWVCKEAKMTDPLSTPLDKMLGPRRHSPFLNKAPKEGLQGFQISLLITDFITNKMCWPRNLPTVFQWGNLFFP